MSCEGNTDLRDTCIDPEETSPDSVTACTETSTDSEVNRLALTWIQRGGQEHTQ